MSTKSLKTQLMAAVAMTLVACIALGSSTFAWFALNNRVTATGMTVKTQVTNNLFIAGDTLDSTAKKSDANFKTSLVTTLNALLEPVSTVNGTGFFYTDPSQVQGNGQAGSNYIAYDAATFKSVYEAANVHDAQGYIDYVFQLKAINPSGTTKNIKLTNLKLTYGGSDTNGYDAFRAAVFVEDITSADPAGTVGTLKGIYSSEYAANFESGKAASAAGTMDRGTVLLPNEPTTIAAPDGNSYYKVVVRLWLEGEDQKCNNTTFAALSDNWMLDVGMEFDSSTDGVEKLSVASTGSKTAVPNTTSFGDAETIDGGTYYKVGSLTHGGQQLYASAKSFASTTRFYVMDGTHIMDVTNQINVTTPTP